MPVHKCCVSAPSNVTTTILSKQYVSGMFTPPSKTIYYISDHKSSWSHCYNSQFTNSQLQAGLTASVAVAAGLRPAEYSYLLTVIPVFYTYTQVIYLKTDTNRSLRQHFWTDPVSSLTNRPQETWKLSGSIHLLNPAYPLFALHYLTNLSKNIIILLHSSNIMHYLYQRCKIFKHFCSKLRH